MSSEHVSTHVMPTFVRRLLWALGCLYVIYLIAGNLLLNTSAALRAINQRPQVFQVQWSHAQTWWPGHIRATQLRVRGHARERLWTIEADQASGQLSLGSLLHRELCFQTIHGSKVKIAVQQADDLKPPPWRSDAWWVTVRSAETSSLLAVRWDDFSMVGEANLEAGFTHQLRGGPTQIFSSDVRALHAAFRHGEQLWSPDLAFDLHFAFDPFTHEQPPGWHKVELARLRLKADGATPTVKLGIPPTSTTQGSALSRADGHVTIDLAMDHGVLAPGGHANWQGWVATADASGTQQREPGEASLLVQTANIVGHARIPTTGNSEPPPPNHLAAELIFDSRQLLPLRSSSETLALLSGTGDGHWHFASLSWLKPIATKPWVQWNGSGEVDAAWRIDNGRLSPGSRMDIPRLDLIASILGNRFTGEASASGRVVVAPSGNYSAMAMTVRQFVLSPEVSPGESYLRGRALHLDMRSSDDLSRFRDTVAAHLQFANADVPDLRAYNRYLPGKSLYFISGHGSMATELTMDGQGDVNAGRMQMHSDGATLALGASHLTGNIHLDTRLAMAKRAGHAFDLRDFTLSMDGVRMEGSSDPPWWTTATLERGRLDWDRPMQLDGHATMRMKDVSLLLSLFAKRSAFPAWIGHIIDDGEAQVTADVHARRGEFIMDNLSASNKRVQLLAQLRIADGQPNGNIYARWGILDVGVALANGQRDFHLVHAARWYQAQPPLLSAAEAR